MSMWSHSTREEMDTVFQLCRRDDWVAVLKYIKEKPWVAVTPMVMDNHIATTVIHQAITSKGDTKLRAEVIRTILKQTPTAATLKNGYGSLALHVVTQRNTKLDSKTKENLIFELVAAHKGALTEEGGVGKRTPLHIIFTDYICPRLTQTMIDNGPEACFMKDKKGYLPAHVACSRHCSPEKLRMLLVVNPGSLYERTNKGETLLSLAISTATKSHPNYALIDELRRQMDESTTPATVGVATAGVAATTPTSPGPVLHVPSTTTAANIPTTRMATRATAMAGTYEYYYHAAVSSDPSQSDASSSRGRLGSDESNKSWTQQPQPPPPPGMAAFTTPPSRTVPSATRPARKKPRKARTGGAGGFEDGGSPNLHYRNGDVPGTDDPAGLLLHFSRNGSPNTRGGNNSLGGGGDPQPMLPPAAAMAPSPTARQQPAAAPPPPHPCTGYAEV